MGRHHGRRTARHFGRPDLEYQSAVGSAAVLDRSHRSRLAVSGRAPVRMLAGVLTNSVPPPPGPAASGLLAGRTAYSAVLIPKGRMVTDLVVAWRGTREDRHGLWLHVPAAGHAPLVAHLRKFLPPRFAFVDDVTETTGTLTAVGPDAAGMRAAAPDDDIDIGPLEFFGRRRGNQSDADVRKQFVKLNEPVNEPALCESGQQTHTDAALASVEAAGNFDSGPEFGKGAGQPGGEHFAFAGQFDAPGWPYGQRADVVDP